MNKNLVKEKIKEIILSSPELKNDYEILFKNKLGYMTNRIHEHCDKELDKYDANSFRGFIAASEENTRTTYANIINQKVRARLEKLMGRKVAYEPFIEIMREVMDDLKEDV